MLLPVILAAIAFVDKGTVMFRVFFIGAILFVLGWVVRRASSNKKSCQVLISPLTGEVPASTEGCPATAFTESLLVRAASPAPSNAHR